MVAFLLGAVLLFVGLELAWRLQKLVRTGEWVWCHSKNAELDKPLVFQSDPYTLYKKKPNSKGRYPSNSLGYAGTREYSAKKPENTLRIFVVGGSTAEDHAPELGPDSSWPAQLEDILRERIADVGIEVINAGLAAYSSAESLVDFLFRGLELEPDVLLVYHGVNDALTIQMADGFKPDYTHVRQVKSWKRPWVHSLPRVRCSLSYEFLRYQLIKEFGWPPTLLERISTPPWESREPFDPERVAVFKRNTLNLVNTAHVWGCAPIIIKWECSWGTSGSYPWGGYMQGDEKAIGDKYFRYLEENNKALKELGQEHPFVSYVEVGPFDKERFQSDLMHFNAQGLKEMAGQVADAIEPQIRTILNQKFGE